MREPLLFYINNLVHYDVEAKDFNGLWYYPRPECGNFGFLHRIKTAWKVFTGKADAVFWD